MSFAIRLLAGSALLISALVADDATAGRRSASHLGHNEGVVGVIAGGAGSTQMRMAADLSSVLDGQGKLRILAIAGKNPVENINDLLYLKGIDAAIVPSDVLEYIEAKRIQWDVKNRVDYVTKLFSEELHLLARKDLASIADLEGKKVNLGPADGSASITGTALFNALKLKIEHTAYSDAEALKRLKSGEIDAMVSVAAKPVELFAGIARTEGLKLVPIELPDELDNRYTPGLLTSAEYPGLIPDGGEAGTLAVSSVLAVFNWPRGGARYDRVRVFIDKFLARFDVLTELPHHPKWREINLSAELPGWKRNPRVASWLADAKRRAPKVASSDSEALRAAFKSFLEATGESHALSAQDQKELFDRFMRSKEAGGQ
jgi:TRAP-type uncharacterized transport system substrate-binding protein